MTDRGGPNRGRYGNFNEDREEGGGFNRENRHFGGEGRGGRDGGNYNRDDRYNNYGQRGGNHQRGGGGSGGERGAGAGYDNDRRNVTETLSNLSLEGKDFWNFHFMVNCAQVALEEVFDSCLHCLQNQD